VNETPGQILLTLANVFPGAGVPVQDGIVTYVIRNVGLEFPYNAACSDEVVVRTAALANPIALPVAATV
jgi:hypothetical protein